MNIWFSVLGSVIFVSLLSLLGLFALTKRGFRYLNLLLTYFVSLAAGIMLGAAIFHLLPEASATAGGINKTFSFLLAGSFIFFFSLEKLLLLHHHHHEISDTDLTEIPAGKAKPRPFVWINLIGGMIHNLIDGVTIAVAFLITPPLGLTTVFATVLHEIPREIGDFAVLIHGGLPVKRAFVFNMLTGVAGIFGAIAVLAIGTHLKGYTNYLLPIAAANFLYIALANLLPELSHIRSRAQSLKQILLVVCGMAVMYFLEQLSS